MLLENLLSQTNVKMIMTRKKLNPKWNGYVIGLKSIYLSKTSSVHIERACWRLKRIEITTIPASLWYEGAKSDELLSFITAVRGFIQDWQIKQKEKNLLLSCCKQKNNEQDQNAIVVITSSDSVAVQSKVLGHLEKFCSCCNTDSTASGCKNT